MPSDFICTLLAPPGSCNLGGFNDFILRAFDNTPYYHMRHQVSSLQCDEIELLKLNLCDIYFAVINCSNGSVY